MQLVALEGLDCMLSVPPSVPVAADQEGGIGPRAAALKEIGGWLPLECKRCLGVIATIDLVPLHFNEGLEALMACQHEDDADVYGLALRIIENHFEVSALCKCIPVCGLTRTHPSLHCFVAG